MKKGVFSVFLLIPFIIFVSLFHNSYGDATSWIPPTNAYQKFTTDNGTVIAKHWNQLVTLKGSGITIKGQTNAQIINFNNLVAQQYINCGVGNYIYILNTTIPGNSTCGSIKAAAVNATIDTLQNLGNGFAVYKGNTTKTNFQFRTITCGINIICGINSTSVKINGTANGSFINLIVNGTFTVSNLYDIGIHICSHDKFCNYYNSTDKMYYGISAQNQTAKFKTSDAGTLLNQEIRQINKASAGGKVFFESGIFRITQQVTINGSGIVIEGSGETRSTEHEGTEFQCNTGASIDCLVINNLASSKNHINFDNFAMTRETTNSAQNLLVISTGGSTTGPINFNRIFFFEHNQTNFADISLKGAADMIVFTNCDFQRDNSGTGTENQPEAIVIGAGGATNIETFFLGDHIAGPSSTGKIDAIFSGQTSQAQQTHIDASTIDTWRYPIQVNKGSDVMLSGATFYNNGFNGPHIKGTPNYVGGLYQKNTNQNAYTEAIYLSNVNVELVNYTNYNDTNPLNQPAALQYDLSNIVTGNHIQKAKWLNENGTVQYMLATNQTSDANAIINIPIVNHNCGTYFVISNSTFRHICNFNGIVHVLGKN